MAKQRTGKGKARAARKLPAMPEPCLPEWLMQMEEIGDFEELLASLFVRAMGVSRYAVCPEGMGVLLARQELERTCFAIVGEVMRWAREDGDSKRSAWAGRFLASLSTVLEKREDWLAEKSKVFAKRKRILSFKFDLEAKPGGPSLYMPHLLRVYDRIVNARDIALDREAWGAEFAERFPSFFAISDFEAGIPTLLAKVEEEKEDAARGRVIFEEIVWPMLKADKDRIEEDEAMRKEMKQRMTETQRKPSFANLKKGFRSAWLTLYARPEGNLRGIERASL